MIEEFVINKRKSKEKTALSLNKSIECLISPKPSIE
jgi:hypothetical protein